VVCEAEGNVVAARVDKANHTEGFLRPKPATSAIPKLTPPASSLLATVLV